MQHHQIREDGCLWQYDVKDEHWDAIAPIPESQREEITHAINTLENQVSRGLVSKFQITSYDNKTGVLRIDVFPTVEPRDIVLHLCVSKEPI